MNCLEKDARASKIILEQMIVQKKETLEALNQDVKNKTVELFNLSREVIVSEKLLMKKKMMLEMVKKEYKVLFTSNMCIKNKQ